MPRNWRMPFTLEADPNMQHFVMIFCLMCMFCRSLFVILSFFFWPLCCLFFFNIRILITPLVSSADVTMQTFPIPLSLWDQHIRPRVSSQPHRLRIGFIHVNKNDDFEVNKHDEFLKKNLQHARSQSKDQKSNHIA